MQQDNCMQFLLARLVTLYVRCAAHLFVVIPGDTSHNMAHATIRGCFQHVHADPHIWGNHCRVLNDSRCRMQAVDCECHFAALLNWHDCQTNLTLSLLQGNIRLCSHWQRRAGAKYHICRLHPENRNAFVQTPGKPGSRTIRNTQR